MFQVQNRFFGADLNLLVDDDHPLPVVLSKLMTSIEVRALFIEGIYRKSGALPTVRNVRKMVETEESECDSAKFKYENVHIFTDQDELNFDETPVHVVATLIKSFFREMAEPLIPFELYENFLNVSGKGNLDGWKIKLQNFRSQRAR